MLVNLSCGSAATSIQTQFIKTPIIFFLKLEKFVEPCYISYSNHIIGQILTLICLIHGSGLLVHRSVIFARDVMTCITDSRYKLTIQLRKFGGEIVWIQLKLEITARAIFVVFEILDNWFWWRKEATGPLTNCSCNPRPPVLVKCLKGLW